MNSPLVCVVLCLLVQHSNALRSKRSVESPTDKSPQTLSRQEATQFIPRRGRDLIEECFGESCSFEDVNEVLGPTAQRDRFWNAYVCRTTGQNCPTETPREEPVTTPGDLIPCSHRRDCSLGQWGQWLGSVPEIGCAQQVRATLFRYPVEVTWRKNCIGLAIACHPPPQESRVICSCNQTICVESSWSNWDSDPPLEGCKEQRRYRTYTEKVAKTLELESCGQRRIKSCPKTSVQNRTICNCRKLICSQGTWSDWQGVVRPGTCVELVRYRSYNTTWMYVQTQGSCDSVPSLESCPSTEQETYKLCSCYFAQCRLGSWSPWGAWTLVSNDKTSRCQRRGKTRHYTMNVISKVYDHMDECPKLPQTCPEDLVETEQKCNCTYSECSWSPWSKKTFDQRSRCYMQTRSRTVQTGVRVATGRKHCRFMMKHCDRKYRETRRQDCYREKNGSHVIVTTMPPQATEALTSPFISLKDNGLPLPTPEATTALVESDDCSQLLHLPTLLQSNPFTRKDSIGLLCSKRVLQIDFKKRKKITGMLNHGEGAWDSLMAVYTLDYSNDGQTWQKYKLNGIEKYFIARTRKYVKKRTILETPITAKHLKLNPRLWTTTSTCLRIKLFGCEVD